MLPLVEFAPAADRTLADGLVRQLRTEIVVGRLQPGEPLNEMRLAEQFMVSRGTVREAVQRLKMEGLVEVAPHRAHRVAHLAAADGREICDLFALLEGDAARHLPLPVAGNLAERLGGIVVRMRGLHLPDEVDRFIGLDHAFHATIVAATGRRQTLRAWENLSACMGVLIALIVRHADVSSETTANRHAVVVDALRGSTRIEVVAAMEGHYRSLDGWLPEVAPGENDEARG